MNCSVIIVAAGKGKRMGTDINKQFIKLNDKSILVYTIECFNKCEAINEIVVVTSEDYINYCKDEIIDKYEFKKDIKIVAGGKERQDSVYNGLKTIASNTDIVLIHDGVRPFIEQRHINNVIKNAYESDACVLGVKVKDTIKLSNDSGFVVSTPKRDNMWAIQTPQAFKYGLIVEAYECAIKDNFLGTDDSMLVERLGYKVKIEEGSYSNIKITTKDDLITAKIILDSYKF